MFQRPRANPENCPVCGADVPRNAKACIDCGACHESGWNELTYDGLDLPDYAYEDEEHKVARPRFRQPRSPERKGMHPGWRVVALVLVLAMFWCFWKWVAAEFQAWSVH